MTNFYRYGTVTAMLPAVRENYCLILSALLLLAPLCLLAEGSKELNQSGGYRPFVNSTTIPTAANPFTTLGTVKVFVNPGERIYLGSSAQGIGNGRINLRAPNGQTYTSGGSTSVGRIANRSQEVFGPSVAARDGGYTPYIITVGAAQGGIWEIDFIPPNVNSSANPQPIQAAGNWAQPTGSCYIAAFDVSVRNTSNNFIRGRVYTNIFTANTGSFSVPFNAVFNVLTNDGYLYTVNNNGQAGFGFSFIANNKGFRNADGSPAYKSIDNLAALNLHDPRAADTETDITHKLFFNTPATDLPASAPSVRGTEWLRVTPPVLEVANITFSGVEGTPNTAGTNPAGGYIRFTASHPSNFNVDIDINGNGVYTDAIDKRLTGTAVNGANTAYWDGTNGQGAKVLSSSGSYNTRVILLAGEVHFPFIDVENNPNGIIITRINGSGAPNNIIYWDDTGITTSGTPSNPLKTGVDGIASSTNGHRWGSSAYRDGDFGNDNGLDTWAYLQSAPTAESLAISLREADLETVSINKTPASLCEGQTVTYTVAVRNNGPGDVSGATYRFNFPAALGNVSVSSAFTSGSGTVTGGAIADSQYTATLNMSNQALVTFTITGTVSVLPVGGSLPVTSAVMRPADVTDPDATNPDDPPPADPQAECDAAPSGAGCNNIKTDVTTVVQLPTTANAGPAQVLCAAVTAALSANTPAVGAGAWSRVSGPGNPVITNTANASTTLTGLSTGVHVFRWTISNGSCTPSTNDVQITVQAALAGNTITAPATVTYCASGDPALITGATPSGGSGTYSYQWQQSSNNTTFTDISGATSASYDPGVLTATTYFRRRVASGSCTTASASNVVTITIQPAISANVITAPDTTSFCGFGDAALIIGSAPAGGSGVYAFQWQSSLDSSTWSDIAGASGQSYEPVPVAPTVYYRRLVTSGTCTVASISNVVSIHVTTALNPGAVSADQSFCVSGNPAPFTQIMAPTGGTGEYTYQWQSMIIGASGGYVDIPGATAAVYDAPPLTQTTYYRRIVHSGACAVVSNVITVTVNPALTAGAIAAPQTFCGSGNPAAFTVTAAPTGGTGTYTYQWQSSVTSATTGFTNIAGATGAAYDAPALSQTTYFRRITRSGPCTEAVSNVVTITVLAGISNNTIDNAQTICTGSTPAALTATTPTGGSGSYTYLWESSTGTGISFTPAAGVNNGQQYTPPSLTQTTYYRRTVSSGNCSGSQSNIILVTVIPVAATANAGADLGPLNDHQVQLAANTPITGSGAWTQVAGPATAGIVNPALATTSVTGLEPGVYTFRWTISNPPCASSSDEMRVTVNTPPVAVNDVATINEDVTADITILSNDTDSDGSLSPGSVTIVNQPVHGAVTVSAAGAVTYTPAGDYNGSDVFSYTVQDNLGAVSNAGTVSITITPVQDPPVAVDDQINLVEDVTASVAAPGVLDNDTDPDGGQLTALIVTPVSNGTLTLNTEGSFFYTPPLNFNGNAIFTYRACDASGSCDTATVTLTVGNQNDVPVANGDTYTVNEDNMLNVPAGTGVLSNDTDADNDPLTANLISPPASGTLVFNTDGSFRYAPVANFNGSVSFVYRACDASGACDTAEVNITVNNVNDAPLAGNDAYNTNEDVPLTIAAAGVLANDTDIDGNALSAAVITAPATGTLALNANGSFVYTPVPNFNGVARFTYRVCDNGTPQLCDTAEVTITIRPVNDTVIAGNDTYTTPEDVPLTVTVPEVLINDTDPDGDPLTVTLIRATTQGSEIVNEEGNFVYVPNANYNGADTFVYRVCDPYGACDTAIAVINITPVNDPPLVNDVNYTGTEDEPLIINVPGLIAAGEDPEGDALTASLVTGPDSGTVTVSPDGSFSYTPPPGFNGATTFIFRLCDNGTPLLCDTAVATITVTPVNDPPAGVNDTFTTAEDIRLGVPAPGVLGNDTDPDGDPLTAAIIRQPSGGGLALTPNGSFIFTPRANFNGATTATYRVCDNDGGCDTATITFQVMPVNDPPVSSPANYVGTEDEPLTINAPGMMFNDYDPDGDLLTATLVSGTANGAVVLDPNGRFTYTPAPDFNGNDTFYYRTCDPAGACDTSGVALSIQPVNDAPVAGNDTYVVNEDDTLTIAVPGVLSNDTDLDGDALTAMVVTPPLHGSVVLHRAGDLEYIPDADFNGMDSFTYIACDDHGGCDTATVSIDVRPVNDAPVTADDTYSVMEDNPLHVPAAGVLFNDTDREGDAMSATLLTPPASGAVVLNPDGSFVYTPVANFNGTVTFTYQACDNAAPQLCSAGTVTIQVTPVNDPPDGMDDRYTLTEDMPLNITAPGLLSNDRDPDNNPLRVTGVYRPPRNGTVTLNADGSFIYVPRADHNGVDSFTYSLCDNNTPAACDTAVVRLSITAVNDAPRLVDDNYSTDEDEPLTITLPGLLFNDTDPDGDAVTISGQVLPPDHGTLTLNPDGSFTYTPVRDYHGLDSFTYRACDPSGACDTVPVRIVVVPVNDPPAVVSERYTIPEDMLLSVSTDEGVLANDGDTDDDELFLRPGQPPQHGIITLVASGAFEYQPYASYNGSDFFTCNICDAAGACVADTIYITITPVNDTVIARNDQLNAPEDTPLSGDAAANDDDPDGDVLTYTLLEPAVNGTIVLSPAGTFTYTPATDFNGPDTAVYQVCDPSGACDTALVVINVGEENDPPAGAPDAYTVDEDEILTVPAPGVLVNDMDPDAGAVLHAGLVTGVTNGTLILQADGGFTYQPGPGFNGADQFTYNACDGNGACVPVTVSLTITPVNDPPVAVNDTARTSEDTPLSGNVLGNDSDPDSDALTVSLVTAPVNGTMVLNADGSYTYTSSPDYNGMDLFVYQVCDNGTPSLCDTTIAFMMVLPGNDPPVAAPDEYTMQEDSTLEVPGPGVLENDADPDGDALAAMLETPSRGALTLNSNGSFIYRPGPDFNGVDSFTYRACDPDGICTDTTVTIHILPVNDPPLAVDDYFMLSEDTVLTFPPSVILGNDFDADGDTLTGRPVGTLNKGTYAVNPDGTYTYTPAPGFFGLDSIQYEVCDGHGGCDTGMIRLEIAPRNDTPVANPDAYDVQEDSMLNIPLSSGVLANDTDVDEEPLISVVEGPAIGLLRLNRDGSFSYRPVGNYNGADTFTYRACDVSGACDTALVILTVLPVNDAPIAINDRFVLREDTVITFPPSAVLANDTDPDGDTLGGAPIGTLNKGTYTANPDGTYTYYPQASFHGFDSIEYRVCDPVGLCDTGVIVIELLPVNDKPVAADDAYDMPEDSMLAITGSGLLANDTDVDGDELATTLIAAAQHGVFTLNPDGTAVYVPAEDYRGPDSVTYSVCDLAGACDTAVVRIRVQSIPDPPAPGDDAYSTAEDTPLTIAAPGVLANDNDPDSLPLTAALAQQAQHGTVTLNADGSFTYIPVADFNGQDAFTYQVCDTTGSDQCVTATVTISVTPVNDTPLANTDTYQLHEDTILVVNIPGVLANDGNADNDMLQASLVTAAQHGSLQLNVNGGFRYTPNAGYKGADSAVYRACNPQGLCDTAVIRFTVNPVNDPPIAVDDQFTLPEDTIVTISPGVVLNNDTDPDGDTLLGRPVSSPANGRYVQNPDGTYTYTPNTDFNGIDSVRYVVCDPSGSCDSAWIRLILAPVDDAPVARPDAYETNEDIVLNVPAPGVKANDSDVDDDEFNVSVITGTQHGVVTMNRDHSFSYVPAPGFNGPDSFIYIACDPAGLCDTGTARIMVHPVNDAPSAFNHAYTLSEDSSIAGNVMDDTTDPDDDPVTASPVSSTTKGTLTLQPDGAFTYVPAPGFSGVDSAVFRVCDNGTPALCDTALLSFIVTGINDAPVAVQDDVEVTGDTATGNVLDNDSDPDGNQLTASLLAGPANGTVALDANGRFTYRPNAGYSGADSLRYRICDNGIPSLCDTAAVYFNVNQGGGPRGAIGLAMAAGTPQLQINGDYYVTYTLVARNMGNVAVHDVQITDELSGVFTTPLTFRIVGDIRATGGLLPNNQYNGSNISTLLAAGSTMAAGASDTVQFTAGISPNKQSGTYNNRATLTAVADVTGENLMDVSTDGLEVDPDSDGIPEENAITPVTLAPTRIHIPGGFSPNNDGKNDRFVVGNAGSDKISLEIFNRWGNVVYKSTDYKNDWDGKCNQGIHLGEDVPDGTYYYIIIVNGTERYVNFITIMR
jgi:gliding motility-associated-like protein/uncharacterized repeat protein (TIGR01451 family)